MAQQIHSIGFRYIPLQTKGISIRNKTKHSSALFQEKKSYQGANSYLRNYQQCVLTII
ncbi:unnamed protein product [Paramecium octaurelia]|uniref:Uncharacterized protein n=1 Tax=Paramecium octaurelia TaxID=43137 RepID=A0A8S1TLP0_PAROT|nr:unnamed protein product [Paramecium octaurelia]